MNEQPNLRYIQEISGGDAGFEKKLLDVVKEELPDEIEEYKANLSNSSFLKAAENVHKLKHKISILGLEKSYQVAVDYEEELKESKTGLKNEFEEILDAMVAFTAKYQ